ncbi:MAG: DNA internalization-related competence protein ComEC/Rec2 [Gammaproteobacteria bacterium]|jgi:competence protein ComEC
MFLTALSLLAGILSLTPFRELPGAVLYLGLLPAVASAWLLRRHTFSRLYYAIAVFVAGICWAQYHASAYQERILPESLVGRDIKITGHICNIPVKNETVQRFVMQIERFDAEGYAGVVPRKLKLSWYYGEQVQAGQTWQLQVRLKPPHGFMNPGGFDYEAWLFQNGIHATGYVSKSDGNRLLQPAAFYNVASIRQRISEAITGTLQGSSYAGLVAALAVGDRSAVGRQQWNVLISTGTNHLMAISGLHIGLAAAFGYWLCRRIYPPGLMPFVPVQTAAIIAALIVALSYATLAGFAIPAQRALLMLICVAGGVLTRRSSRPPDVLACALILVLIRDPSSILSAGFWFSFLAVAAIFYAYNGRFAQSRWLKWLWIQLVIALALFPLSLFLFQQTSLVSPLANLLMVPYVSLLVVPLVLTGTLMLVISSTVSTVLFTAADRLFEWAWPCLQWLSALPYSYWTKAQPGMLFTLLALLGVAIALAPALRNGRAAGILLILPAITWQPQSPVIGAFELNVLDVGQGLAIVIRTHAHTLVYDTGARFSTRMDSGEAVIRPFLTRNGIARIDLMLISHGDADHIGGARSLLNAYPGTAVMGQGIEALPAEHSSQCNEGQSWTWDGVVFTVLHPDDTAYTTTNNRSCVLKVAGSGGSVLMTGDIGKKVENRLLLQHGNTLSSDILIAPHHGSKSSSSMDFIRAVSPTMVIYAAGYRNRYHFPAERTVARYAKSGVQMYTTGLEGAISVDVHPQQGVGDVRGYRTSAGKYWNHKPPKLRQDG